MAQGKQTNQRSREPRKSGGIWSGILIGLLTGLAGAAAVAVWVGRNNPFTERPNASATQSAPVTAAGNKAGEAAAQQTGVVDPATHALPPANTKYDFYHILPGKDANLTTATPSGQAAADNSAAEPQPQPEQQKVWLQVGAFPDPQQADDMKAKLALMGIESSIQTVDLADKGIWHRVRLGPYSPGQINDIQAQLVQNHIASTVIENKASSKPNSKPNSNAGSNPDNTPSP